MLKSSIHRLGEASEDSGHNSSCEFQRMPQSVRRFPKFLWVWTHLHPQNPTMGQTPHIHHPQTLSFDAVTYFGKFKVAKGCKSIKNEDLTFLQASVLDFFTWNMHGHKEQSFVCQESQRAAIRNSSSHKINLFSKPANSLLCLKLQGKLFGIRMTYGSQTNPTFPSSPWVRALEHICQPEGL